MLPVRRVGIGELWKLLNEDGEITGWWARWADGEANANMSESENGHTNGQKLHSRSR